MKTEEKKKMNPGKLLTVNEVTQRLRIGKTDLYRLIAEGEIAGTFKIGGKRLFSENWIENYIEQKYNESL